MEEWREIPGYEGIYEVSSFGNVRSMERIDPAGRRQPSQLRKIQIGKRGGYAIVNLRKDRKTFSKKIHHLVAFAFLGMPPAHLGIGGVEVNHKNGNKRDNQPTNLEYCTRSQNLAHAVRIGLRDDASKGIKNGRAKLDEPMVREIRRLYATGLHSIPQLAKQFSVGKSTIGYIVQGVTWSHLLDKS